MHRQLPRMIIRIFLRDCYGVIMEYVACLRTWYCLCLIIVIIAVFRYYFENNVELIVMNWNEIKRSISFGKRLLISKWEKLLNRTKKTMSFSIFKLNIHLCTSLKAACLQHIAACSRLYSTSCPLSQMTPSPSPIFRPWRGRPCCFFCGQ